MHRITISNGITAIGGYAGIGKTGFTLKLANFLAQSEKVLFFSTHHYKEHVEHIIQHIDTHREENLHVETDLEYIYSFDIIKFYQFIEDNGFRTLVLDDFSIIDYHLNTNRKKFIEFLQFISKKLRLKIIVVLNLYDSISDDNSEFNTDAPAMNISMFNYVHSIQFTHICTEIYALHRPHLCDVSSDKNLYVYPLKNAECTHSVITMNIDHARL
ncbi:MAG: hypothetical protein R6U95_05230 [Bacteroidales bacterium]